MKRLICISNWTHKHTLTAAALTAALMGMIVPNILTAAPNFTITDLPDGSIKVTADDTAAGDEFGEAVAVSGNTAVIGAWRDDDAGDTSGAAYVFTRDSNGDWTQRDKLTANDAAAGDSFGWSVALSGDTAVIGARRDDDAGASSGSAYVFTRDSNSDWTQQDKLTADDAAEGDLFGWSVALSGNTAVIGAAGDDDAGDFSGSAYVFIRDGNGDWTQQDKLTADDAAADDDFGESVSVSGDTAVVGAPSNDDAGSRSGSAYVFTRDGNGDWTQQDKLTADDAAADDRFGFSVAVSSDTVVVGAPSDDRDDGGTESGSAYIFTRNGNGDWMQQDKLTATDAGIGDFFGRSVALSGNTVVAGAHGDDDGGADSGSAYVFTRDGNGDWTQQDKLTADDAAQGDLFGWSVAVSSNTAVVGAYWDDDRGTDSGSAYIYIASFDADVNNDGFVTPADAIYVINRVGSTDLSADIDGDGDVDQDDVDIVINAIGTTVIGTTVIDTIPTGPSTITIVLLGASGTDRHPDAPATAHHELNQDDFDAPSEGSSLGINADDNLIIYGNSANNTITGGKGDDTIYGGDESCSDRECNEGGTLGDTLNGGDGNDTINGGNESCNGTSCNYGHVTLGPTRMGDTINGGAGNDTINGGNESCDGNRCNRAFRQPQGGAMGDTINGGAGDDIINGGDESCSGIDCNSSNQGQARTNIGDTINGGDGSDTINGGDESCSGQNCNRESNSQSSIGDTINQNDADNTDDGDVDTIVGGTEAGGGNGSTADTCQVSTGDTATDC